MSFSSFSLNMNATRITAEAKGHADEVLRAFREAAGIVFVGRGAWRITSVHGECPSEMQLDSDMEWSLRAELKN